ncbi:MAG: hypothetical protein ACJAYX_002052, partial [Planctomycetota bacterium]
MAKSSVAARSTRTISTRGTTSRTTRTTAASSTSAPSRRKPVLKTIPSPQNTSMTDAELEIIWKTYKRTRDETLRNTL